MSYHPLSLVIYRLKTGKELVPTIVTDLMEQKYRFNLKAVLIKKRLGSRQRVQVDEKMINLQETPKIADLLLRGNCHKRLIRMRTRAYPLP